MMRILLNKNKGKKMANVNNTLTIKLDGSKRLLPSTSMHTTINEVDLYNFERKNSNKIRLTCKINTICSNVLFNKVTEIVKDEGSSNVACLNFNDNWILSPNGKILGKNKDDISTTVQAIRDTQLSNVGNGFQYHCGLDIFNNHILRSKTFKTVCQSNSTNNELFNTIGDMMRDYDGNNIIGYYDSPSNKNNEENKFKQHLYLAEELYSFKECIDAKLIEDNGWYGFKNVGKFPTYKEDRRNNDIEILDIYKVINSKKPCDFIDMYPERDLFYFTPKYNSFRKRVEKNWHYCLTYPSSSTTEVDFINQATNSLKIFTFDDTIKNSNGTKGIKFISVAKHGLTKGDIVNIYNNTNGLDTAIIKNAEVTTVVDDYIFFIYCNGQNISNKWYSFTQEDINKDEFTVNGLTYKLDNTLSYVYSNETKYFTIDKKKVCLDESVNNLSFKRVIDGEEVMYYVRIFSRLPNWKYADEKPTEENIYKDNARLLKAHQTIANDFESHVSKLAFSKNIYNDDIAEIVFTDTIDISHLKDNLGRPLTEIYLTLIKNNSGYKEWYGIEGRNDRQSENIEYSHCFGRLTCAFSLSPQSMVDSYVNSRLINNVDNEFHFKGLDTEKINNRKKHGEYIQYGGFGCVDEYEIHYASCINGIQVSTIDDNGNEGVQFVAFNDGSDYQGDTNFYGDLVVYSPSRLMEEVIQQVDFRFNTVQREYCGYKHSQSVDNQIFDFVYYDEISSDDYDFNKFMINDTTLTENSKQFPSPLVMSIENGMKEGYIYKPHYQIPIKTFSSDIHTERPIYYAIKDVKKVGELFDILTAYPHYLHREDILTIKYGREYYRCIVKDILSDRKFRCLVVTENDISIIDPKQLKLVKASDTTPDYAVLSTEGSCYYMWRDVIENGFDNNSSIESYPFSNGSFYINKDVNLFVKRQDPKNEAKLQANAFPFDPTPKTYEDKDTYYTEEDITC